MHLKCTVFRFQDNWSKTLITHPEIDHFSGDAPTLKFCPIIIFILRPINDTFYSILSKIKSKTKNVIILNATSEFRHLDNIMCNMRN